MDIMIRCIACGGAAGPHRLAFDPAQQAIVGGLCRCCERDLLHRTHGVTRRATCVFCGDQGTVALPRLSLLPPDGGHPHERLSWAMEPGTPWLCGFHYRHLGAVVSDEDAGPRAGS